MQCSEEIDGAGKDVAAQRQGLLDGPNTWRQGVGARRMLHRYVGTHLLTHDDLQSSLLLLVRNGAYALCWTTHERRSVCLSPRDTFEMLVGRPQQGHSCGQP